MKKRMLVQSVLPLLVFFLFSAVNMNAQSYVSNSDALGILKVEINETVLNSTTIEDKYKVKYMSAVAKSLRNSMGVAESISFTYDRFTNLNSSDMQIVDAVRESVEAILKED